VTPCVIHAQVAQADLQKIADSVNQAQAVYKQLKARREELGRAVEALKLMHEWQARRLIPLLLICAIAEECTSLHVPP